MPENHTMVLPSDRELTKEYIKVLPSDGDKQEIKKGDFHVMA